MVDTPLTRTLSAMLVAGMGLVGIAIGNRIYGHLLLREMVRAARRARRM
jgi:hypothetical protein